MAVFVFKFGMAYPFNNTFTGQHITKDISKPKGNVPCKRTNQNRIVFLQPVFIGTIVFPTGNGEIFVPKILD